MQLFPNPDDRPTLHSRRRFVWWCPIRKSRSVLEHSPVAGSAIVHLSLATKPCPSSPYTSPSGRTSLTVLRLQGQVYHYRNRCWRVRHSDQSSKISLIHFSTIFMDERVSGAFFMWKFGAPAQEVGTKVWGVGFWNVIASWVLLFIFFRYGLVHLIVRL